MNFKRNIIAAELALALIGVSAAQSQAAQAAPAPTAAQGEKAPAKGEAAKKLDLKAKELDQIEKILDKDEDAISKARAEIQILQAKIARLILEKEPPMDQVRGMVKESLDWELQVRMIQLERQIAIRKVLGEARWARVIKLVRDPVARGAALQKPKIAGKKSDFSQRIQGILARLR